MLLKSKNLKYISQTLGRGKAIPLQAWTGPECSRRLRLPDFMTVGARRWLGCQPYALAASPSRKYSWYSFLLEAESTPGPQCSQGDYISEKFHQTLGTNSKYRK